MRIPTFHQFQRQAQMISQQFDAMRELQQQVSSGKKLINYSDDPVLANQIHSTSDYLDQLHSYDKNGVMAQQRNSLYSSLMQTAVSAMNDISTQLQRVQGTSATSDANRQAISGQIKGDLDILLNIANSRDENGNYIFSGFNTGTQPFASTNGTYVYQGSYDASKIDVSLNAQSIYNESGYKVFGNIPLGNGYFTVASGSGNTGTASTSAGNITSASSYVADTYTISFAMNSLGKMGVVVTGAASGQVIPAPAGDPPTYTGSDKAGMDLTFNGITLNVSGVPQLGDTFTVQPTTTQNAFQTIQDVITTLQNPIANQGKFDQLMRQANASFSQITSHLSNYQASVGSQSNNTKAAVEANKDAINYQTELLGQLQDADMADVYSRLAQQSLALQATQEGYLKIQETFNQLLKIS